MSFGEFERLIGRAVMDEGFRNQLLSDPGGAAHGFDLTAQELEALRNLRPANFGRGHGRNDGAIHTCDYDGNIVSTLDFFHGLISEMGFPAVDGASKDDPPLGDGTDKESDKPGSKGRWGLIGVLIGLLAVLLCLFLVSNGKVNLTPNPCGPQSQAIAAQSKLTPTAVVGRSGGNILFIDASGAIKYADPCLTPTAPKPSILTGGQQQGGPTEASTDQATCEVKPNDGICSACENSDLDPKDCICNNDGVCGAGEGCNCSDCVGVLQCQGGAIDKDKGGNNGQNPCLKTKC